MTVDGLTPVSVGAAITLLYGAILCGSARGQTVGMMALKTRVVTADQGTPLGFWRAAGRAAFEYLLFVLVVIPWVLDMLWPLWDARNQTLHDKISGTVVVSLQAPVPTGWDRPASDPSGYGPSGLTPPGFGQPGSGLPGS